LRIEVDLWHGRPTVGIVDRDLGLALRVEVERGGVAEDAHGVLDCRVEDLPDRLFILELDLRLGGMDIHVDVLGRDVEIEEERHLLALRDQPFKSLHHRFGKIRMAHVSAVDKEILMSAFLLCRLRLAHKAMDATERCLNLHGQEILIESVAEDVDDTLSQSAGPQVEQFRVVAVKPEDDIGIDEDDALEGRQDIVQLGVVGLEELTSGGHVEEEILHHEVRPLGTGTRLLPRHLSTGDGEMCADVLTPLPRLEFHLCHGGYRRQRLAAESHGMEVEEIIGLPDL